MVGYFGIIPKVFLRQIYTKTKGIWVRLSERASWIYPMVNSQGTNSSPPTTLHPIPKKRTKP